MIPRCGKIHPSITRVLPWDVQVVPWIRCFWEQLTIFQKMVFRRSRLVLTRNRLLPRLHPFHMTEEQISTTKPQFVSKRVLVNHIKGFSRGNLSKCSKRVLHQMKRFGSCNSPMRLRQGYHQDRQNEIAVPAMQQQHVSEHQQRCWTCPRNCCCTCPRMHCLQRKTLHLRRCSLLVIAARVAMQPSPNSQRSGQSVMIRSAASSARRHSCLSVSS